MTEGYDNTSSLDWILSAWFGTALSGSVFGAFFGVYTVSIGGFLGLGGFEGLVLGGLAGLVIAAVVGGITVPSVAAILWVVFFPDSSKILSRAIAGSVTGVLCGGCFWPVCIVPAIFGAIGAVLPAIGHLRNEKLVETEFQFTTRDLMLRTAVVAVLIVVWGAVFWVWNNPGEW